MAQEQGLPLECIDLVFSSRMNKRVADGERERPSVQEDRRDGRLEGMTRASPKIPYNARAFYIQSSSVLLLHSLFASVRHTTPLASKTS